MLSETLAGSRPRLCGGRSPKALDGLRLGLVCDFAEENWPSMDLVADMLESQLRSRGLAHVCPGRVQPPMPRRFRRLPVLGHGRAAWNGDRLLARFWDYPHLLRRQKNDFDCFHICDHSYAHLVHELPANRTGVYCHDLDTFRCLLEPEVERRSAWFLAMTRRILRGLQQAAVVFCSTNVTGNRFRKLGLVDPARLIHAPYGIAPEFSPDATARDEETSESPFLLHVGSCIPRKRIDMLLEVFAALRQAHREINLVQVGGQWTSAQQEQIKRHGLVGAVRQLRGVNRSELAALYRRAALVLLPSDAEGFGLPVIEALACGAVVLASDFPVLREVGGEGVVYCPVADVNHWVETVSRLLADPYAAPDRATRIAQARRFSWEKHAETILGAYQRLF